MSRRIFKLRFGRRNVTLGERTLVMGVLNVTPDSFSDGGCFYDSKRAIARGLEMVRQGADWIDVGGESTRPGSKPVPIEEELHRVLPVIRELHNRIPNVPISIDTTKAEVAEAAARAGASILNDVSGLRFDLRLADVARRYRTPLVLMHSRGRPETMQQQPFAKSIWRSVRAGLARSIRRATQAGVRRSQLIIDPGLGFGKSRQQNYELLAELDRLQTFRLPILVGTSRKSFVRAMLEDRKSKFENQNSNFLARRQEAKVELLAADAAAVVASILAGAHIVRVHDVSAILPAVCLADAIENSRRSARGSGQQE